MSFSSEQDDRLTDLVFYVRGEYAPYIDAVEKEIIHIMEHDKRFIVDRSLPNLGGDYTRAIYKNIREFFVYTVFEIVLAKESYENDDIYTALFFALEGTQKLKYLLTQIRQGKIDILVSGDHVQLKNIPRSDELKDTLPRDIFEMYIDDMGVKFATNEEQVKKTMEYMTLLTYDVVFAYCKRLKKIFTSIESSELARDVTSQDIQELWSERYGSKNL